MTQEYNFDVQSNVTVTLGLVDTFEFLSQI